MSAPTAREATGAALRPTPLIDAGHPAVAEFAAVHAVGADPRERAVNLYLAVRDRIRYDPYCVGPDAGWFRASDCLLRGRGFCIPKAGLMAACARAARIPARVGYADVRNHLSTPKLTRMVGGDVYTWHSYAELWLGERWVKCTPAFDIGLCRRFGVRELEFDGCADSLLQPFDRDGRRHMEYLGERGVFLEIPLARILEDFERNHPIWLHQAASSGSSWVDPAGCGAGTGGDD